MNRRSLIRTVTGVFSAVAFTSTGWLMGARTLTSGGAQMPPPPSSCAYFCASARNCEINTGCQSSPKCNTVDYYWYSHSSTCPTPYDCFISELRGICDCTPCIEP
jgi:hypothetical protein